MYTTHTSTYFKKYCSLLKVRKSQKNFCTCCQFLKKIVIISTLASKMGQIKKVKGLFMSNSP